MNISSWKIEWLGTLSLSNPEMDSVHQRFSQLVNELDVEISSQQRDKAVVEHIMSLILEDAIARFSHEERLFVENNYPAVQEHAQIHSELISKLRQALIEIQNTDIGKVWVETSLTIKDLLVDHIFNEDIKYTESSKGCGR
jgi:hemerythrin-like metal-binding protein